MGERRHRGGAAGSPRPRPRGYPHGRPGGMPAARLAERWRQPDHAGVSGPGHAPGGGPRAARDPAESARTMSEWSHWDYVVIEKWLAPGWRTVVRGVTGPFMPLARAWRR
jgi:hypothetical protein